MSQTDAKPAMTDAKESTSHVDHVGGERGLKVDRTASDAASSLDADAHGIDEKKLIRRVDLALIPWLAFLYLLSFLDRTNIGNASIFGLQQDLQLVGNQYSACLAVFFGFYVIFEAPSNAVMARWRPSLWLSILITAWAIVITLTGIVQNYAGLFAARVFLGITEAGLFPGVSFYLTMWYRRTEVNFRIALFFSSATIAGAFGGLIARGIQEMDGLSGLEGWRFIFIIEGAITFLAGLVSPFILNDYPNTARFLKQHERDYLAARLRLDSDGLSHVFKKKFVLHAFTDWKVWAFSFMYIGSLMPVYAFSLFSPTLIKNLGYTAAEAQLLSVPPYVLAAFSTIFAGWLSDHYGKRGVFAIFYACVGIVGFILCIFSPLPGLGYAGLFVGAAGIYPLIPLIVTWSGNNIGGKTKRGIGMAIVISIGNAGGIISSYIYRAQDSPRYFLGHAVVIGFVTMTLVLAIFMLWYLGKKNRERAAEIRARGHDWTAEEKESYEDEGDKAPFFFYTL